MSREVCTHPLRLDLSREPVVRLYETSFDIAQGFLQGERPRSQIDSQREYMKRIFGESMGAYIMDTAFADADELVRLPETAC